ncbi:MAG: glycine--tRNA ligase subunit beta [Thermoanaerobaculia bacterium]
MDNAPKGEFLLEVRAEEIPARMLPGAIQELGTRLFEELMARGIAPASIDTAFTPRRLVVILRGLPAAEKDRQEEILGPPVKNAFDASGKPTAAVAAFAKKAEVSEGDLRVVEAAKGKIGRTVRTFPEQVALAEAANGGGEYLAATKQIRGRATEALLAELVPRLLLAISWPKTMRWGTGIGPWVRPVHGVVALFEGAVVPFELFGVPSGAETAGHSTLSPASFSVEGVESYIAALAGRGIVVFQAERKNILATKMAERAKALGGALVEDDALLTKLAAICEIPGIMEGSFSPELIELPREVLATSLRDHQSALTVEKDGRLLPVFLTVMDRADDPIGRVRAGNEWVVAARLADAKFFFEKDRAVALANRSEALSSLTFQHKLGSFAEKTIRLRVLSLLIAELSSVPDRDSVATAASLLKVDLTTEMVKEFTDLQGVVGGLYARAEGASEAVWQAIYDQYRPAGAADALPRGSVGQVTALADRLDTLVGFFGLGLIPTGSKDPFGLRRSAMGIVRIVLEGELEFDLQIVLRQAFVLLEEKIRQGVKKVASSTPSDLAEEPAALQSRTLELVTEFLRDRLTYVLGEKGFEYDEIAAAMGADGGRLDFRGIAARAAALKGLRKDAGFAAVAQAAKRIANITKGQPHFDFDPGIAALPAEKALAAVQIDLHQQLFSATQKRDFAGGLESVGKLAPPLEVFFRDVMVMDPDEKLKRNRIALLQSIQSEILSLADLSQIVVATK